MQAINLLIFFYLHVSIFKKISADQIKDPPSFVVSNNFEEPLVTNIKCHNRSFEDQEFSAQIKRPLFYTTKPIIESDFENKNNEHPFFDSNYCSFEFDQLSNSFNMKLTNFKKCSVSEMRSNDNKPYLSISVRFPQLPGLRTKNDLQLVLICKEQTRVYTRNHELDFRPGDHLTINKAHIFANEPQKFHVSLQLYASHQSGFNENSESINVKTNRLFEEEDDRENTIEVGETVKLKATVRSGDGWNYAFLKNVIISRVTTNKLKNNKEILNDLNIEETKKTNQQKLNKKDTEPIFLESKLNELFNLKQEKIVLVDDNGCRNSMYKLIAPLQPYQTTPLEMNFEFKAFTFENMDLKNDRLRISAKIIACQQLNDCEPTSCEQRRKKRWAKRNLISTTSEEFLKIETVVKQLDFRVNSSKKKKSSKYVNQDGFINRVILPSYWLTTISLLLMSITLGICVCLSLAAGSLVKKSDRVK